MKAGTEAVGARGKGSAPRRGDTLPMPSMTLDASAVILEANRATAELLRTSADRLVGLELRELVALEDAELLERHLGTASREAERPGPCDLRLLRRDGSLVHVRMHSHFVASGAGSGAAKVLLCDLSDLERRERATAERLASTAAILDAAFDAIVVADQRARITAVNAALVEMFGYREEELLGRGIDLLLPALHREDESAYAARHLFGAAGEIRELCGRRRDGTTFPLEVGVGPLRDEGCRLALTLRDISRRKRLEREFLRSQKLEAIGRLASGVAHDFNNLLMGISGCANIALGDIDRPDVVRPLLEEIAKATASGAAITRQLLDFGRRRRSAPEPVEVDAAILATETMMRRLLDADIELRVALGAPGARVSLERSELEQVLLNLIVNGRDAMPRGGRLAIETREETRESETRVVLVVSDTGCGMDEDTQRYLFEPFFTTKQVGEGTGLGLSTVYGIVEQHGGSIELESEPGVGTTFILSLPRLEAEEAGEASAPSQPRLARGTVLVVEDQAIVRRSIRHYLERHGYGVFEASDGKVGLDAYKQQIGSIDLLLTDIVLPGLSGTRLAREIHALDPGIPVVYMSAYSSDRLVEEGRLAPGMLSLQKPFFEDALISTVQRALEGTRGLIG